MSNRHNPTRITELANALSVLKTPQEIEAFLVDLLTPSELRALPNRWFIVTRLAQNIPYQQIQQEAVSDGKNAGNATIVRAKRALDESTGGFKVALDRTTVKIR